MKNKSIPYQRILQDYIRTYGITAAVDGTGLTLCEVRSACTDPEPVYDHLVRVYHFYCGLAYELSLRDTEDMAY